MEKIKIDLYISNLLYQYDCVIVPELGGFITNYAPAKLQQAQHKFHPPSKSISFNQNLKSNDGLLANHIAERKLISYAEAFEMVRDFAKKANSDLHKGSKIVIEKVGTLYNDKEGNTCFSPDGSTNYLQDSFGLESFRKKPIVREAFEAEVQKKVKEAIPLNADKNEESSPKKRGYWAAAAVLALAVGGFWFNTYYYQSGDVDYLSYSNFNIFSSKPAAYQPKEFKKESAAISQNDNFWIEKTERYSELVLIEKFSVDNSLIVDVEKEEKTVVPIDNTAVALNESIDNFSYHIVGGCFSVYSNAETLLQRLQNKGYQAKMIGKINGLHAVSYNSFATRQEALEFLFSIRQNENPQAWLMVK